MQRDSIATVEGQTPGRPRWVSTTLLTLFLPLVIYAALPPAVPNLDGFGYHERIAHSDLRKVFFPGHLLYGPMILLFHRLAEWIHPTSLLTALRFTSLLAGALGAFLTAQLARCWGASTKGQYLAALGIAFSSGYWISAADVETYTLALLGTTASILMMTRYAEQPTLGRAAGLALANSLSALMQLQLLSLATASLLLFAVAPPRSRAQTRKAAGTYLLCMGLGVGLPYLLVVLFVLQHRNPLETYRWLVSSSGGLSSAFDLLSLPRALYGLGRLFVFLDFFDVAQPLVVALKGSALLVAGIWALRFIPPLLTRLPPSARLVLGSTLPFVLIHAVFGLSWYPSEVERWLFFLPLVWAILGFTVPLLPVGHQVLAGAAVCLMFGVNLISGVWPMYADTSTRDRVFALQRALRPGTLMISPGHDWCDYYHFYTGSEMERVDLATLGFRYRDDPAALSRDLADRLAAATAGGRPIAMIRVLDPSESVKTTPWPELAIWGHPLATVRRVFEAEQWEEARLDDPARTRLYWLRARPQK